MKIEKCSHYSTKDGEPHYINGICKNGFPVRPACYAESTIKPNCMREDIPEWMIKAVNVTCGLK